MIAVDSGFIYALLDRTDAWHQRARDQAGTADEGWICTWPVITETCHLFERRLGIRHAFDLLDDVADGGLTVWEPPREHWPRIAPLMRRYANLPMDLADASLVLLAEYLGHGRILSTDQRDFDSYRWKSRQPFHNLLA